MQLLTPRQLDTRHYHRGDWVDVGKQTALKWLAEGTAIQYQPLRVDLEGDCGVLLVGPEARNAQALQLKFVTNTQTAERGDLRLPWERTLLWDPVAKLRGELIPAGFGFLSVWEVAIPLVSHSRLARDTGTRAEQARTAEVVGDLRVPIYRPDLVFARRCEGTEQLLAAWEEERGGDESLALLRAIYRVKPLILALPCTWVTGAA